MISVVHMKAGNGRIEVYCPFPKVTTLNLVAGRTVNLAGAKIQQCIDDARGQSALNPVDRVAKPPIAV